MYNKNNNNIDFEPIIITSRTKATIVNTLFNYCSFLITIILNFVCRSIFIKVLGIELLGVNGLLTSLIGILSFAELGIGTAINVNLYKPVANNDFGLIKSYMNLYKKIYKFIALAIAIVGLSVLPFLNKIIVSNSNIGNIYIFYILFLINTVCSYFVSYQIGLFSAAQKNYIYKQIITLFTIIKVVFEIFVLIFTKNYYLYLIINTIFIILQQAFQYAVYNRTFRFLSDKNISNKQISNDELLELKKNTKAGFINKISNSIVLSTDNVIISSFINIASVGLYANYILINSTLVELVKPLFIEIVPSLGNVVVKKDIEFRYEIFKKMFLISFWLFSIASFLFIFVSNDFVSFWIGSSKQLNFSVVVLIGINSFFSGLRLMYYNYKQACRVLYDDQYHSIITALLNLIISIIGVIYFGLFGVVLGTLISGLYENTIKVNVSYKRITGRPIIHYYTLFSKYIIIYIIVIIILNFSFSIMPTYNIPFMNVVLKSIFVLCFTNCLYYILFRKSREFTELITIVSRLFLNLTLKFNKE